MNNSLLPNDFNYKVDYKRRSEFSKNSKHALIQEELDESTSNYSSIDEKAQEENRFQL